MLKMGRGLAVRLFLSACLALALSCSRSSPTEPMVNHVNIKLAIAPGFVSTDESAVLVQSDICSCTNTPVTVFVNGTMAGAVGCGETKSLPIAATNTFNILVQSPDINSVTGSFLFGGVPSGASFRLPIKLTCSQR